jgi:hypothetical protein
MITEDIDLDQVLDLYDAGEVILVGPLLRLSISKYRYFFVASQGSKICESVGVGFAESEDDAQKQYEDIVKKLENRFAETVTFGDHVEMARAVHSRWPNEETIKFLANAEAIARTAIAAADGDCQRIGLQPNDGVSEIPRKPHESAKQAIASVLCNPDERDTAATIAMWTPDYSDKKAIPGTSNKLLSARDERERDFKLAQAILWPKQHVETANARNDSEFGIVPGEQNQLELPHVYSYEPGDIASAAGTSPSPPRRYVPLLLRRICLVGCAAIGAFIIIQETAHVPLLIPRPLHGSATPVPSSISSVRSEAAQNLSPAAASVPAPAAEVTSTGSRPVTQAKPEAQQDALSASIPADRPHENHTPAESTGVIAARGDEKSIADDPRLASGSAATLTSSAKPAPSSHSANAASGNLASGQRLGEDEIAMLVNRGNSFIESGDLASARLLLKRAAEGGSADAALRLGETFDPKFLNSLGALGINSDLAMARQWYESAVALGSAAAAQRLARRAN